MGKIIWICVGAVIVWAGTILLMHRIQTKKIKKLEDDYREKQRVQQKLREEYSVKVQNKQAKIAALQSQINPHFPQSAAAKAWESDNSRLLPGHPPHCPYGEGTGGFFPV